MSGGGGSFATLYHLTEYRERRDHYAAEGNFWKMISRVFLKHPRSVNETYFEHMGFAAWFAARLFQAGLAAAVHAIFPNCFEKTASGIIAELYQRTHNRGR